MILHAGARYAHLIDGRDFKTSKQAEEKWISAVVNIDREKWDQLLCPPYVDACSVRSAAINWPPCITSADVTKASRQECSPCCSITNMLDFHPPAFAILHM